MNASFILPRFSVLTLGSALLFGLASCHSAEKAVELPAAPTAAISVQGEPAVSGDLSNFVEVVPGTYQVSISKEAGTFTTYVTTVKLKVRLTKPTTIKAGEGYNHYGPELVARLHDASGAPIEGADDLWTQARFGGNLAALLKQGKGEEWLTFTDSELFMGSGEEEKAALPAKVSQYLAALQGAKKISLTSQIVAEKFEDKATASTETADALAEANQMIAEAKGESSTATSTDSDSDCDAFLKGYEEYVNDYMALAKEMQENPSDATLLARSSALSMKAAGWAGKMQGCQNDASFQVKYMALSTRMASGM